MAENILEMLKNGLSATQQAEIAKLIQEKKQELKQLVGLARGLGVPLRQRKVKKAPAK